MNISKKDAEVAIRAIDTALDATHWRRLKRSQSEFPLDRDTEQRLRTEEDKTDGTFALLREKLKAGL